MYKEWWEPVKLFEHVNMTTVTVNPLTVFIFLKENYDDKYL